MRSHTTFQYQSPHIITHPSSLLKGLSTHPIHVVQDVKTPQTQCEHYHCSPGCQNQASFLGSFNLDAIPRRISNFWPMNGQRTKCLSLLHISMSHSSIGRKFKELTECDLCTYQRVAVNPIICSDEPAGHTPHTRWTLLAFTV